MSVKNARTEWRCGSALSRVGSIEEYASRIDTRLGRAAEPPEVRAGVCVSCSGVFVREIRPMRILC